MRRPADNPFRVSRLHALRFRHDDGSTDALYDKLIELERTAQIIGPHGSGKSTLLDEMAARLADDGCSVGRLHLSTDQRRPTAKQWTELIGDGGAGRVLVVDGADLLPCWRWWRLRRAARALGGLIVTTHRPLGLPTLIATRTTPALLDDLIGELVDGGVDAWRRIGRELLEACDGDVRAALRGLYERWADGYGVDAEARGAGWNVKPRRPSAPARRSA